jgi:hypothetical protein
LYLLGSLRALVKRAPAPSPALLAAHLRLAAASPQRADGAKLLRLARAYTAQAPASAPGWRARLDVEQAFGSPADAEVAWADARKHARGEAHDLAAIWLWGMDGARARGHDEMRLLEVRVLSHSVRGPFSGVCVRSRTTVGSPSAG